LAGGPPSPPWGVQHMRLTVFSDYTLRTLIYLALRPGTWCTIDEIAGAYGISVNHLTKVVHQAAQAGEVQTLRGQRGGLRLARRPEAINIGAGSTPYRAGLGYRALFWLRHYLRHPANLRAPGCAGGCARRFPFCAGSKDSRRSHPSEAAAFRVVAAETGGLGAPPVGSSIFVIHRRPVRLCAQTRRGRARRVGARIDHRFRWLRVSVLQ
jgi:hypothetical protein